MLAIYTLEWCILYFSYIPVELRYIIRRYLQAQLYDRNIREVVYEYFSDEKNSSHQHRHLLKMIYGHISYWDTGMVTNLSKLFIHQRNFNEDISSWDVSNVTDMSLLFRGAYHFNQPIEKWDVSNVTNMEFMFCCAKRFNRSLAKWNVSKVTRMSGMFYRACSFNQNLATWNVSEDVDTCYMFYGAGSLNQESIREWKLSQVQDICRIFQNALFDRHTKMSSIRYENTRIHSKS